MDGRANGTTALPPSHWAAAIRLIMYTRYSLLTGLGLMGLGVLPVLLPMPTIATVYQLENWQQLGFVTYLSLLASATVIITFRTTQYNAAVRFEDPLIDHLFTISPMLGWWLTTGAWLAIALPAPLFCALCPEALLTQSDRIWGLTAGMGAGVVTMLLMALARRLVFGSVVARFGFLPLAPMPRPTPPDENGVCVLPKELARFCLLRVFFRFAPGPGYTQAIRVGDDEVHVLRPGHGAATVYVSFLLAAYAAVYFWTLHLINTGYYTSSSIWLTTLCYLQIWLMIATIALTGLAFLLDRYRIPTLTTIVLLSFVGSSMGILSGVGGHRYQFNPPRDLTLTGLEARESAANHRPSPLATATDVVAGWKKRTEGQSRTFVIVTASGGGIQAAGWTSRVLTKLDEIYGDRFSNAVGMISSVSGGSVANFLGMGFWDELADLREQGGGHVDDDHRDWLRDEYFRSSTASTLEAIAWGLVFPDLLRYLGFVTDEIRDRGWVQEEVWRQRLADMLMDPPRQAPDWRLGDLADRIRQGRIPAPVFNAVLIDTGQRLLISPAVLHPNDQRKYGRYDFVEFAKYGGASLRAATAARLSATFPYITPTSSADRWSFTDLRHRAVSALLGVAHVGDGGFADNDGILTAFHWIQQLQQMYDHDPDRPFDHILLIRIAPFPIDQPATDTERTDRFLSAGGMRPMRSHPWFQANLGPVQGIYNTRTSSQSERSQFELDLLLQNFQHRQHLFRLVQESHSLPTTPLESLSRADAGPVFREVSRRPEPTGADDENMKSLRTLRLKTMQWRQEVCDHLKVKASATLPSPIQLETVLVDFQPDPSAEPPLSWKLTPKQVEDLNCAWEAWIDKTADTPTQATLDRLLRGNSAHRGGN